jgi:hypothetical protein
MVLSKTFEKMLNHSKAKQREERKSQGYFDGRFRNKVVPNKKREHASKESRKKVEWI